MEYSRLWYYSTRGCALCTRYRVWSGLTAYSGWRSTTWLDFYLITISITHNLLFLTVRQVEATSQQPTNVISSISNDLRNASNLSTESSLAAPGTYSPWRSLFGQWATAGQVRSFSSTKASPKCRYFLCLLY